MCLEDILTKGSVNELINDSINDGGDCRTAPATPGLLNTNKRSNLKECSITSTRRYGPLRGPTSSSCGGLRPSTEGFFLLQKKILNLLFWPIFGNFLWPVVPLVTLSSNLSNFERNCKDQKNPKKF